MFLDDHVIHLDVDPDGIVIDLASINEWKNGTSGQVPRRGHQISAGPAGHGGAPSHGSSA